MNIDTYQPISARLDAVCDYIPGISTVSNLVNLFIKAVVHCRGYSQNEHYFRYIDSKSWSRCLILLIPGIGNLIIIALHALKPALVKPIGFDKKELEEAIKSGTSRVWADEGAKTLHDEACVIPYLFFSRINSESLSYEEARRSEEVKRYPEHVIIGDTVMSETASRIPDLSYIIIANPHPVRHFWLDYGIRFQLPSAGDWQKYVSGMCDFVDEQIARHKKVIFIGPCAMPLILYLMRRTNRSYKQVMEFMAKQCQGYHIAPVRDMPKVTFMSREAIIKDRYGLSDAEIAVIRRQERFP
jgi:hypothetical protein